VFATLQPFEVQMSTRRPDDHIDRVTLVASAIVAYALANIIHECLGHGGTCVAVGARLEVLSAVHAECDVQSGSRLASALVMAAGTVANLLAGAAAWLLLRRQERRLTLLRYFLWLFMTVNLLQATGYWLFSGVANIGDWAGIIAGLEPHWAYRLILAAAGAFGYWGAIHLALRTLNPMLGDGPDRLERARTLTLLPYLAGGILYVAAGALNPVSPRLVLISAAAASFGGTSALAWMTNWLRPPRYHPENGRPLSIHRSMAWIVAAVAVAFVFVVVLGPGVRF
jgi:hypothetical protein